MPGLTTAARGKDGSLGEQPVWRCACGATVGCHAGTTIALGRPGSATTGRLRARGHELFDAIVAEAVRTAAASRDGRRDRERERLDGRDAKQHLYALVAVELSLTREEAHFARMTNAQCRTAVAFLEALDPARVAAALPRGCTGTNTRAKRERFRPGPRRQAGRPRRDDPTSAFGA